MFSLVAIVTLLLAEKLESRAWQDGDGQAFSFLPLLPFCLSSLIANIFLF